MISDLGCKLKVTRDFFFFFTWWEGDNSSNCTSIFSLKAKIFISMVGAKLGTP
jgi:hypothetical protein